MKNFRKDLEQAQAIIRKTSHKDLFRLVSRDKWFASFLKSVIHPSLALFSVVPPSLVPDKIKSQEIII